MRSFNPHLFVDYRKIREFVRKVLGGFSMVMDTSVFRKLGEFSGFTWCKLHVRDHSYVTCKYIWLKWCGFFNRRGLHAAGFSNRNPECFTPSQVMKNQLDEY